MSRIAIGIGINKAATTWIHKCLGEHPDICTSKPKETNYFSTGFENGAEWYKNCFAHCKNEKVRVEYSPGYLHYKGTARRIKNAYPNASLILCLRNPVERVISAFFYNKERGAHSYKTLGEKLDKEPSADLSKGLYDKHVKKWFSLFPRNKIYVCIYEDIQKDPVGFIQKIYKFLGVDDTFVPPSSRVRVNPTKKLSEHIPGLNRLILRTRRVVKNYSVGRALFSFLKLFGIHKLAEKVVNKNKKRSDIKLVKKVIKPETRKRLQKYYANSIENLEKIIDLDLSAWK